MSDLLFGGRPVSICPFLDGSQRLSLAPILQRILLVIHLMLFYTPRNLGSAYLYLIDVGE